MVRVGTARQEKRWPPDTPLELLEQWRVDTRYILSRDQPRAPRGTLAGDLPRYLKAVAHLVGFVTRRSECRAWLTALGPQTSRTRITPEHVRRARADWLADGTSPKTVNNRVFTLGHWYRTLDGQHTRTPVNGVAPLPVPRRPAVRVPDSVVREIYQRMLDKERQGYLKTPKTRARFAVFASTGHRPSEIGRIQRQDIDLPRRVWTPRDGKGGFCPGVNLNTDMLEAFKLFIAADAFGSFDTESFGRRIRSCGLPPEVTPYQLRHTVGIAASDLGADLKDISDHLGHKRLETTRRHYVPVLETRLQRLSEALEARALGWHADEDVGKKSREKVQKKPATDGTTKRHAS